MVDNRDIVAKIVPPVNKHTDMLVLEHPMVIITDIYEGYPVLSLKLMNFYGSSPIVSIPLSAVLYQTEPRYALENFYIDTVGQFFDKFNMKIDLMLERFYDTYKEHVEEQSEKDQLYDFFEKIIPSSNTSIQ